MKYQGSAQKNLYLLHIGLFFLLATIFSSCATTKNSRYFSTLTRDTSIKGFITPALEFKVRKGDHLGITISSKTTEEDALFNQASGTSIAASGFAAPNAFIVDQQGYIQLHRLNNFKAEGYSLKELAALLKDSLSPYMKDIVVNIKFLNRKVTVLGEVARPSVLSMQSESLSLLDALALSGDMKETAIRKDVIIIREEGEEKKVKHVNLEDHSVFTSSWYYLQPNDIVYVIPDFEKKNAEERKKNLQTTISLVTTGVTFIVILLDRLIK